MYKVILLAILISIAGCTSKPKAVVGSPPPTAEESLATAQIGVATQKSSLIASYFAAVADCNKEKDFVLKFQEMKCPDTGCEISMNGSNKQCDSPEARSTLVAALNTIKEPKTPENFYSMMSSISEDFTGFGLGIVKEGVKLASSSNVGLLGTMYYSNKMLESAAENAGARYSATGDLVLGNNEVVNGMKAGTSISQKTTGGDDISGSITTSTETTSLTAGTNLNTGTVQIEAVSGTKAGNDAVSASPTTTTETTTEETNTTTSTVVAEEEKEEIL